MSLAEDVYDEGPRFESVEAFLDWVEVQPGKWELIDGVARPRGGVTEMMAGGTRTHALIARNALVALAARLGVGPCQAYGSDFAVRLGPLRTAFPDVSVSCEPEADGSDRATDSPVVIVEVLSPSTASYDLGDKASAYRRVPSLRHLVLVRQDRIGVQHFHREVEGQEFGLTEIDQVDGRLALTAIGVEIALADLYARVTFTG
jgi:Uma2 family endonuclease